MTNQITVTAKYVKLPGYSTFPLHGVYGGVGGNGLIAMHLYSEAPSLPDTSTLTVDLDSANRVLTSEEKLDTPGGTERVVSATYYADLNMAKSLITWLQERVDQIEAVIAQGAPQ